MESKQTLCDCGHVAIGDGITTGYGQNQGGQKFCFDCCAKQETAAMIATGRACLYLVNDKGRDLVTDWPGKLRFPVEHMKTGRHNIAGKRFDVWFTGPQGQHWHGTAYGEQTQLCHCRRIA